MKYISPIDWNLDQYLWQARADWLTQFFFYFTELGEWRVVSGLALIFMVYFWVKKEKGKVLGLAVSVAGSAGSVFLLKYLIDRPRPTHSVYLESLASFPSAHAALAMAFYGLLFYFLIQCYSKPCCKRWWGILSVLFILLMGFSRLYLGVHYLSDVIAGYLVGLVWLWLGILIEKKICKVGKLQN